MPPVFGLQVNRDGSLSVTDGASLFTSEETRSLEEWIHVSRERLIFAD